MKPFKHEIQKKKWDKLRKRKLITGIAIGGCGALAFSGIGVGVGYVIWHNSKNGSITPPPTPTPTSPVSLIIDGTDSSGIITIPTTLNQEGEYQFYCHDNTGNRITDATWQLTGTDPLPTDITINLNSSTGELTWSNNLTVNTAYSFSIKCSKQNLTDGICTINLFANATPGNDVCPYSWFDVTAGGELSLKTGKDKNNIRNLVIPSMLNGITVTSIADNAFADCLYLNSLTLPNTLTSIGLKAFDKCSSITSLALTQNIPSETSTYQLVDGITGNYVIDNLMQTNAFLVKTADAELGKIACTTQKDLGGNNGSGIATKTLTIPSVINNTPLTMIDGSAFNDCSNIVSLTITNSNLQTIGGDAFRLCSSLEYIDLGSIGSLGQDAFAYCPKIREFIYTRTSVASDDDDLVAVDEDGNFIYNGRADLINGGFITEYRYSLSTWYSHNNEYGLDCPSKLAFGSIRLPAVAKYISNISGVEENGAFRNALSIHSVIVGDTVESINYNTFENCTSLASVSFSPTSTLKVIQPSSFERCTSLTTIRLPETLEEILNNSSGICGPFKDCTSLVSINIPYGLADKRIGNNSFQSCMKLKLITVAFDQEPQNGTIGYSAFSDISDDGVIKNTGGWDKTLCLGWFKSHGLPTNWTAD